MRLRRRKVEEADQPSQKEGDFREYREKVMTGRMPSKLRILKLLIMKGPMKTKEICAHFKLKPISVLQHLSTLRKCRLVGRVRGKWQISGNTSLMASQIDEALERKKERSRRRTDDVKLRRIRRIVRRSLEQLTENQLLNVLAFITKNLEIEKRTSK